MENAKHRLDRNPQQIRALGEVAKTYNQRLSHMGSDSTKDVINDKGLWLFAISVLVRKTVDFDISKSR